MTYKYSMIMLAVFGTWICERKRKRVGTDVKAYYNLSYLVPFVNHFANLRYKHIHIHSHKISHAEMLC